MYHEVMTDAIDFEAEMMRSEAMNYYTSCNEYIRTEAYKHYYAYVALIAAYTELMAKSATNHERDIEKLANEHSELAQEFHAIMNHELDPFE